MYRIFLRYFVLCMYSEFFKFLDRFDIVNPTSLLQFQLGQELKNRNMLGTRIKVKMWKPILCNVIYLRIQVAVLIFGSSV